MLVQTRMLVNSGKTPFFWFMKLEEIEMSILCCDKYVRKAHMEAGALANAGVVRKHKQPLGY